MNASTPAHRRGRVVDEKILSAVIAEIEATGTLSIKVDDVAAAAGVNKTTIYRRYRDRNALVLAAVLAVMETEVPIPDTGSLAGDLDLLASTVGDVITSPLGRALLSATADSRAFADVRQTYWASRFEKASEILRRATERGECRRDVDAKLLLELMVAPLHFRATQIGAPLDTAFIKLQVERALHAAAQRDD